MAGSIPFGEQEIFIESWEPSPRADYSNPGQAGQGLENHEEGQQELFTEMISPVRTADNFLRKPETPSQSGLQRIADEAKKLNTLNTLKSIWQPPLRAGLHAINDHPLREKTKEVKR